MLQSLSEKLDVLVVGRTALQKPRYEAVSDPGHSKPSHCCICRRCPYSTVHLSASDILRYM
ncbi:hypothetical protein L211DRAFT_619713 [Terfezia boudieri ATCC MYA-4762]|uniref:Uncharacterized protein n=1 Tax=Terfezia boudieri ATCC MYA-4762 TaxID=1051890 RepID=A0A3N4L9W4_9PEZI|nr:hypothetical protein L211DRAFT_619713 [Terfezia boudieri ATCC MYA-4762]